MRRLRYFGWKQRKGIALLLVMFIAFASLVLLTTLYSSLAPRAISVRGQAQSDRALALADGTIDRLLDQINNTGLTYDSPTQGSEIAVTNWLVTNLLLNINGGPAGTVLTNVRHYFYDITTDTYYVYKNDGDFVATGPLTNLSTNTDVAGGLVFIDNKYASDNRWFEMDANAKYWYNPGPPIVVNPDTWELGVTAFNLSNPDIKRTIRAEAKRGQITTGKVADGNWYVEKTGTTPYFSDYAGLYHSRVNFGRFEVVSGYVRSDSDLWMGGWAQDKVSAHGTVNDMAIDAGNAHVGRFGIDALDLAHTSVVSWPGSGFVTNGVPEASWPKGDDALGTLLIMSKPAYFVSHSATIVFSVVGGVGKVSLDGGPAVDLPPIIKDAGGNVVGGGSIYVNGDATISGEVLGKVTIGASNNVFIGGNITYNNPPRTDKNAAVPADNLQDKLGLIARNNIIIPVATYNAGRTLEIDAAMLAVHGYFGIDANYGSYLSHNIIQAHPWVGIWSGSQSVYSGASAPAWSNGSNVWGYEEQHTNYDYNLANGARPPFFPAADDGTSSAPEYVNYTGSDLTTLRALTQDQLTPLTAGPAYDDGMRYTYNLGGTDYYCSNASSWIFSGEYTASANSLYRVSWKEEIAQPVESP
jgi:type II secretory pathway pseudopilin PulG